MAKKHAPRRGSWQFWPRMRSKKSTPRIRSWFKPQEPKIAGFAGYKAGMTHIEMKDNPKSPNKDNFKITPVTVIECPPLKVIGLRFYKKHNKNLVSFSHLLSSNVDKELLRRTKLGKSEEPQEFDEVRLLVHTQPKLTGIGKKKPELFEIGLGGNKKEALELGKSYLGKELTINDVFKEGQFLDVHGITKGKGFQGTVKRFGVIIRQHKSEKTKRGIGNLGSWTPKRVQYTVPQPGKMGYHLRTEYNKWNLMIGDNPEDINPKGGFLHYGLVKNNYLLLKGSVPGPAKRLVILTNARRSHKSHPIELKYISKESKQ